MRLKNASSQLQTSKIGIFFFRKNINGAENIYKYERVPFDPKEKIPKKSHSAEIFFPDFFIR